MLKINILFFLITIVFLNGYAQESSDYSIELTPHFKNGEIRKYQIKYTSKSQTEDSNQVYNTTKEDIVIRITDVQPSLISFEWTYVEVTFVDSALQYNPIMYLMNTLTQGVTVKYITDRQGVIKSITNYKEISAKIKQRFETVIEKMSKDKSIASSLIESTKFQFEMMFSTDQLINDIVISDVFKFHELYGHSFTPKLKLLIQAIDSPSDKYETQVVFVNNNLCRFEGTLAELNDKRNGYKTYDFEVPSYWLNKYTSKSDTSVPILVSQFYEINLVDAY